jgi:hypothetical protein
VPSDPAVADHHIRLVVPAYDHAEIICVAAATVVFDTLSVFVANNSPSEVQPDQDAG